MADSSDADRLASASARGELKIVEMLLQNGANVNEKNAFGRTPLQVMKLGNPSIAEALLKAKANPNERDPLFGLTVAHDAARDGFEDTLRVLVDYGADVNIQDSEGNLPLHLAAKEGNLDVVKFLIERTIEPRRANRKGMTAHELAAMHNRQSTAQWIEGHLYGHVQN
ncbi:cyclin-dependent kinase 4 inhibitor C-like isoform X1 [Acipenser oxyrinchus oxyrinchus]|uniref:Cyclin-dependent kinase 4 inhibitor C-like isoform X1 n=1 Tax=Acipenser oxyrinchus oxyrinchus TaxID=40147 RepID=A0AAD8G1G6_ACIOX|nr:cyclin-dependent kinase 4 inhibitor C-like isoform X1 [Acipenser oxyrinchus oxyrinchus]